MTLYKNDTIAAIATARGNAGVAVVRISGPEALKITEAVFQPSQNNVQYEHGRFYYGFIVEPQAESGGARTPRSEIIIDEVIALIFKSPNSLTGEDVVEIQCHGGDYLTHKILNTILAQGDRMAEPGEFTKRAFLNSKMDLTQAESVMDLVSAQGARALAAEAANLKNNTLAQYVEDTRQQLIALQMQISASTDFPDEVDEPDRMGLKTALMAMHQKLTALAEGVAKNRMVREGLTVAILGLPNAGKSSVFNALLASERAIVTEVAGTTRDVITETLSIGGVPVTLVDTAGIRTGENTVEILGIERSWQAATAAQAVVYVYDAALGLQAEDTAILLKLPHEKILSVANKSDLINGKQPDKTHLKTSVKTGEGIGRIYKFLEQDVVGEISESDTAMLLNRRQEACLQGILENLNLANETLVSDKQPLDLVTVPLTDALLKVDELTGRDTREEVLDSVFSQFCVGK